MIIGFITAADVTHKRFVECVARPAGPDWDRAAKLKRIKGGVVERRLVLLNTQGTHQLSRHKPHTSWLVTTLAVFYMGTRR